MYQNSSIEVNHFNHEFSLYKGNGNLSDILFLYDFYSKKNNIEQFNRIKEIAYRYVTFYKNNTAGKKLIIQFVSDKVENTSTYIFPVQSYTKFMDLNFIYNIRLLTYLIRENTFTDITVHKSVVTSSPELIPIISKICQENNKHIYIYDTEAYTEPSVTQQVISDKEDAKYVETLLTIPSEICLSTFMRQCNIKCHFCEHAYRNFPKREIDFTLFKKIIQVIPEKLFCKVSATPYMEPLTSKKFLDFLTYALIKRPDANIGFNTNGVLLTKEKSELLVDIGLKYLVISLNMPTKKSHQWFCGGDFFDKIVRNIKLLHTIKQQKNSSYPKVTVQLLNLPPVVGNEKKLRKEWMSYCDYVFFRNVSAPIGQLDKIEELKQVAPDIIETQIMRPEGRPCASTLLTCSIDYMGYYVPCCLIQRLRDEAGQRIYPEMEIGHVDEMDVLTAWRSEKWAKIRCQQLIGMLPLCRNCTFNQASEETQLRMNNGILRHCYKL